MTVICDFVRCPYNSKEQHLCRRQYVKVDEYGMCRHLYKKNTLKPDWETIEEEKMDLVIAEVG